MDMILVAKGTLYIGTLSYVGAGLGLYELLITCNY